MPVTCEQIISEIEKKYPLYLAEDYDNCGLIIGNYEKPVQKILVCLDVNFSVVSEAVEKRIDMIISHHPLIFKPIKRITNNDYISVLIQQLIKNDINLYALHTNFDNSKDGLNYILGNILELEDIKPLSCNKSETLYKLAVYVPTSHVDMVRDAIFQSGCGSIGNYAKCSFNINGIGTFMPLEGASPYTGEVNKLEYADEIKIETVVCERDIKNAVNNMIKAHPYEEVAYDIYKLENNIKNGAGIFGHLKKDMSFNIFCQYVKNKLNIPYINVSGDMQKKIRKVAVVGGAGLHFYKDAVKNGCDVLITGDVKHHDAIEAVNAKINIIDGGHYFTEAAVLPYIADFILSIFNVECTVTNVNTNPFVKV